MDPGAILITGCSSGIGRATALRLASRGLVVYATARRLPSVAELEGAGCRLLELDVTSDSSAAAAVRAVEAECGFVGALVNNAGFAQSGAVEAVPLSAARDQFETNVIGYARMIQLVLPGMRSAGRGRIVNVSSVAGRVTMPGAGWYSASKFAVEALSDALRFEVAGFGVSVSLVEPGPIASGFTTAANEAMSAAASDGVYASYHEAVAKADAETDASFLAGKPEQVARTIERALTARRPRPRYRVTPVARLLPAVRGALPDRAWDAFLRTQAPAPKP